MKKNFVAILLVIERKENQDYLTLEQLIDRGY